MRETIDLLLTPALRVGIAGRSKPRPGFVPIYAEAISLWLRRLRPASVITTLGLGVPMMGAEAAHNLDIPYSVFSPGSWHSNNFPPADRTHYARLLESASVVIVPELPDPDASVKYGEKMTRLRAIYRAHEAVVTNSDIMIICWEGEPVGSVFQTVTDCIQQNRAMVLISPGQDTRLLVGKDALARALVRRQADYVMSQA